MTGGLTPKAAPNYPRSYFVRGKKRLQPLPLFPAFVVVLGHTELAPSWFPTLFYIFLTGLGLPGHLEMFSSWPWPGGWVFGQEEGSGASLNCQFVLQLSPIADRHSPKKWFGPLSSTAPPCHPPNFLLPSCSGVSFQFLFFRLLSSLNPCFKSKLMGGLSSVKAVFGFPGPAFPCWDSNCQEGDLLVPLKSHHAERLFRRHRGEEEAGPRGLGCYFKAWPWRGRGKRLCKKIAWEKLKKAQQWHDKISNSTAFHRFVTGSTSFMSIYWRFCQKLSKCS